MSDAAKKAKAEADNFYAHVGRCITAWSKIEAELFKIFMICLQAPTIPAAIVFQRSPSLDARLKLTAELVACILPKREPNGGRRHPDSLRWKVLLNRLNELVPVRNQIAHSPVEYWSGPVKVNRDTVIDFTWLNYDETEYRKILNETGQSDQLIIDDLENHVVWVAELEEDLKAFSAVLPAHVEALSRRESQRLNADNRPRATHAKP